MGIKPMVVPNLQQTGGALLQQLRVQVTHSSINNALLNHPDYPSLLSITDVLRQWNIASTAIRVDGEKLHEIPVPFIAYTKNSGGSFFTITQTTQQYVSYASRGGGRGKIPLEEFLKNWTGIALLAEAEEKAGEKDFLQKRRMEFLSSLKLPVLILTAIGISVFAAYQQFYQPAIFRVFSTIIALKLAGVVITVLLLWYEIDKANPVLKQICGMGSQTNCAAVLGSKQAKLFGVSWSEIGFFYFAGGFISLLVSGANAAITLQLLAWLNVLALPYTIFSVYYQWRIAKQWCPLCLGVQAILIAEFVTSVATNSLTANNIGQGVFEFFLSTINYQLSTFLAFLLPITAWYLLKPLLLQTEEAKRKKRELLKLKYDNRIFNALLPKQKRLEVFPNGLGIVMGNLNATHTIIKVCNPYCGPCANAHPQIDALLEANSDVKVQIIFTATSGESDTRNKPVKHLLAVAGKNDGGLTKQALDDWYLPAKKDYETFAAKYPMNGELAKQDAKVEAMNKWCMDTAIAYTPTFFVNGYQLPDIYTVGDLQYFLSI